MTLSDHLEQAKSIGTVLQLFFFFKRVGLPHIVIYSWNETEAVNGDQEMFDRPAHFSTLHEFIFALDDRHMFSFCLKRLFVL